MSNNLLFNCQVIGATGCIGDVIVDRLQLPSVQLLLMRKLNIVAVEALEFLSFLRQIIYAQSTQRVPHVIQKDSLRRTLAGTKNDKARF